MLKNSSPTNQENSIREAQMKPSIALLRFSLKNIKSNTTKYSGFTTDTPYKSPLKIAGACDKDPPRGNVQSSDNKPENAQGCLTWTITIIQLATSESILPLTFSATIGENYESNWTIIAHELVKVTGLFHPFMLNHNVRQIRRDELTASNLIAKNIHTLQPGWMIMGGAPIAEESGGAPHSGTEAHGSSKKAKQGEPMTYEMAAPSITAAGATLPTTLTTSAAPQNAAASIVRPTEPIEMEDQQQDPEETDETPAALRRRRNEAIALWSEPGVQEEVQQFIDDGRKVRTMTERVKRMYTLLLRFWNKHKPMEGCSQAQSEIIVAIARMLPLEPHDMTATHSRYMVRNLPIKLDDYKQPKTADLEEKLVRELSSKTSKQTLADVKVDSLRRPSKGRNYINMTVTLPTLTEKAATILQNGGRIPISPITIYPLNPRVRVAEISKRILYELAERTMLNLQNPTLMAEAIDTLISPSIKGSELYGLHNDNSHFVLKGNAWRNWERMSSPLDNVNDLAIFTNDLAATLARQHNGRTIMIDVGVFSFPLILVPIDPEVGQSFATMIEPSLQIDSLQLFSSEVTDLSVLAVPLPRNQKRALGDPEANANLLQSMRKEDSSVLEVKWIPTKIPKVAIITLTNTDASRQYKDAFLRGKVGSSLLNHIYGNTKTSPPRKILALRMPPEYLNWCQYKDFDEQLQQDQQQLAVKTPSEQASQDTRPEQSMSFGIPLAGGWTAVLVKRSGFNLSKTNKNSTATIQQLDEEDKPVPKIDTKKKQLQSQPTGRVPEVATSFAINGALTRISNTHQESLLPFSKQVLDNYLTEREQTNNQRLLQLESAIVTHQKGTEAKLAEASNQIALFNYQLSESQKANAAMMRQLASLTKALGVEAEEPPPDPASDRASSPTYGAASQRNATNTTKG